MCEEIDALGRRFSSLLLAVQGGERERVRERGEMGEAERPRPLFPSWPPLLLVAASCSRGERERERVGERER
jgi:hypothetical protein